MSILIFMKTISDMFYSLSILDYALMAVSIVIFVLSFRKTRAFYIEDWFAFGFMALLCLTLIRTGTGFNHFVKMFSGFMLYFIGRGFYKETSKAEMALVRANYIVLLVNLALFVAGEGFVTWGSATTFRGLYFYKTDFSIAMIYAISAFVFFENPVKIITAIEWALIAYLVLRSNARAALLILFLVFGLWMLYRHERKTGKPLKINIKYVSIAAIGLFAAIYIVVRVLNLSIFANYHFLSFSFENITDLFNTGNTQGRNVIWDALLRNYRNANGLQKAIGIDFVSDYWNNLDAHNAYLKILFSTGFFGATLFVGFIAAYIRRLNKLKDRSLFYYNVSILMTFIVQSLSQASIDFTQMTWIFLFFAGVAVSESYQGKVMEYHFNIEQRPVIRLRKSAKFLVRSTEPLSDKGKWNKRIVFNIRK